MSTFVKTLVAVAAGAAVTLGASAQALTRAQLEAWLADYGSAWEKRDADAAARIFTPDATYHENPFENPKEGRAGIKEYWAAVTEDQRDVDFTSSVVAVNGNTGVALWHAKFTLASNGAAIELDGAFVLEFDANGLCKSLREWWHVKP